MCTSGLRETPTRVYLPVCVRSLSTYPFHCWAEKELSPYPFHCWLEVPPLLFTRFTVGQEEAGPGPRAGITTTRFTVGGQFWHAEINTVNVRKRLSLGSWTGVSTFPFHCWAMFRTSPVSHFLTFMRGRGPYTGARRTVSHSPVSLLGKSLAGNLRHVSEGFMPECTKWSKDTRLAMLFLTLWSELTVLRMGGYSASRKPKRQERHIYQLSDQNCQKPPVKQGDSLRLENWNKGGL